MPKANKTSTISPTTFIDRLVKKNELGQPFTLMDHQREILRLAFAFDEDSRLPWDTILYSCVKKSGKTTLNGALTLWWAATQEAPNEILILANDLEQSLARVFKTMEGIIQHNPELQREAEVQSKSIFMANGTTITAISGDYAGSAGSNHGFVSYDELWAYTSESSTRLWEELTPVPTRRNSIRFVSSYSGFHGESLLLWDLYRKAVASNEHPEGQGDRIHPTFPIYANREARLFAYWIMSRACRGRLKSITPARKRLCGLGPLFVYMRISGRSLSRHSSRRRCGTRALTLLIIRAQPIVSRCLSESTPDIKHDNAARVAVKWDETGEKLILVSHRIWKPTPSEPLDLENTVEEDLRDLNDQADIVEYLADPYQFHRSLTTLQAAGLPINEFPPDYRELYAHGSDIV